MLVVDRNVKTLSIKNDATSRRDIETLWRGNTYLGDVAISISRRFQMPELFSPTSESMRIESDKAGLEPWQYAKNEFYGGK
jgi:hypothetical protein